MASADYYADSSQHGDYQYITLNDIINNFIANRDSDDYTSTVPRYKVLYQARRAFRELYYDAVREIRAVEIELGPTLTMVVPPDFINFVRISWVDEEGQLHPMAMDTRQSIAQRYLQDNDYELLFDNNGCVLQDNGLPYSALNNAEDIPSDYRDSMNCYSFCDSGFTPNVNYSNVYSNGKFNYNRSRGLIEFGSNVKGKTIVLEYISDGMFTGCEGLPESDLRIHKFAETAVLDYMYYELIKQRRNVPAVEKQRARKEFYNSKRKTKRRINTIRYSELMQAFKSSSVWIKK
ncbi:MAG: hypothetical protein HRU18_03615 [Pseudoalteromonas sp.]|uniref:hypothetical protein n=1 Tax=Pseudoalteromonas sp. TaxID=53249 RepID=UPI001D53CB64|nr:hypothetical protein [Pseudoalteromonas sp.]NRA77274.1 hypothetical protein [Pseudoalteromonas sp.]